VRAVIADLAAVRAICERHGAALVEDSAHTMGAAWDGRPTGRWGRIGCFSAQTYKHINSGEGGLLVTDDDDVCAQAILYSGSYMFFGQHRSRPADAVFERWRGRIPNFSLRMSNAAAAMLRPQLAELPRRAATWNRLHARLVEELGGIEGLRLPRRDAREQFVASSIQFFVERPAERIAAFIDACAAHGLHIKWFGVETPVGFTSNASHWGYLPQPLEVERSLETLGRLCDMRIPLDLSEEDCRTIGRIVRAATAMT
jgi:dTDP-4-amino-4,6-dideoxygalactose transaminase